MSALRAEPNFRSWRVADAGGSEPSIGPKWTAAYAVASSIRRAVSSGWSH